MATGRSSGVRYGLCCQRCFKEETEQQRLKVCSRCNFAYYCSVACQKSHWQQHKPMCNERAEQQAEAKKEYGTDFIDAQNRWIKDARRGLTMLVHRLLTNEELSDHVVFVVVDYLPEETPQFKVIEYHPLTLPELRQVAQEGASYIEDNMRKGQSQFAKNSGGRQVLGFAAIVCRNMEAPVISVGLGSKPNVPIRTSADDTVRLMNSDAFRDAGP